MSSDETDSDEGVFFGLMSVKEVKYWLRKERFFDDKYWAPLKDLRTTQFLTWDLINFYSDLFSKRFKQSRKSEETKEPGEAEVKSSEAEVEPGESEVEPGEAEVDPGEAEVEPDDTATISSTPSHTISIKMNKQADDTYNESLTRENGLDESKKINKQADDTYDESLTRENGLDESKKINKQADDTYNESLTRENGLDKSKKMNSPAGDTYNESLTSEHGFNESSTLNDTLEEMEAFLAEGKNSGKLIKHDLKALFQSSPQVLGNNMEWFKFNDNDCHKENNSVSHIALEQSKISIDDDNRSTLSCERVLRDITDSNFYSLTSSKFVSDSSWETCSLENSELQQPDCSLPKDLKQIYIGNAPHSERMKSRRKFSEKQVNISPVSSMMVIENRAGSQKCGGKNICECLGNADKNRNKARELFKSPECRVINSRAKVEKATAFKHPPASVSKKYRDIQSPVARYIHDSPQVPLLHRILPKAEIGAVKEHIKTPTKSCQVFATLPMASYKPADKVKLISEMKEAKLPKNIEKLMTQTQRPEVIKHTGRENADKREITKSTLLDSNIEDLTDFIELESTRVAEVSVMVANEAKKSYKLLQHF